jgi:hypothetical protein
MQGLYKNLAQLNIELVLVYRTWTMREVLSCCFGGLSLDYISPLFIIFFLWAKVFFNVRNSIINGRLELTQ